MSNYYISKCCKVPARDDFTNGYLCPKCGLPCAVIAMIDSPCGVPREESPTDPSYPDLDILIAQNLADISDAVNEGTPTDVRNLVEAQTKITYQAGLEEGMRIKNSGRKMYQLGVEEERIRLIKEIKFIKENCQKITGSFKYDSCYDEVIELLR